MFTTTIHSWFFMMKIFLYTSMTNFFCTRIRTLLLTSHGLYTNPIYIQRFFFIFSNTHLYTKVSSYTLVALTHKNSFPRIIYTQESFYTHFLLHTCINKNLFLFFMNTTFIHSASFFLLGFLVHFILLFLGRRS